MATFNVRHGRRPDGVVDVPLVAHTCRALDADILGLQEVDRFARRSGRHDLAAVVAAECGMHHAFGAAHRLGLLGRFGNALLARAPVTDVEVVRLPGGGEPRACLVAAVGRLAVACTHLSRDRDVSARQLDAVVDLLTARPRPRLLLGDLNRRDHEVGLLAERGFSVAGGPPTYPASAPRLRVDHVAVDGMRIGAVDAPPSAVSDHRPLVVELW